MTSAWRKGKVKTQGKRSQTWRCLRSLNTFCIDDFFSYNQSELISNISNKFHLKKIYSNLASQRNVTHTHTDRHIKGERCHSQNVHKILWFSCLTDRWFSPHSMTNYATVTLTFDPGSPISIGPSQCAKQLFSENCVKSVDSLGWNFVHKQSRTHIDRQTHTHTQTNCRENKPLHDFVEM